jgi:hypothetical protein
MNKLICAAKDHEIPLVQVNTLIASQDPVRLIVYALVSNDSLDDSKWLMFVQVLSRPHPSF